MNSYLRTALLLTLFTFVSGIAAFAAEIPGTTLAALSDVQKYGDRYSLLGSMVLWVFWPSFCAALVSPAFSVV